MPFRIHNFRSAAALIVVRDLKVLGPPIADVDPAVILVGVQGAELAKTRGIAPIQITKSKSTRRRVTLCTPPRAENLSAADPPKKRYEVIMRDETMRTPLWASAEAQTLTYTTRAAATFMREHKDVLAAARLLSHTVKKRKGPRVRTRSWPQESG